MIDSKKYALSHDFGYGVCPELKNLKKINLRNIEDLKVYLRDLINSLFTHTKDNIIKIENYKIEIIIEKLRR